MTLRAIIWREFAIHVVLPLSRDFALVIQERP
jgi:hypothetical protein